MKEITNKNVDSNKQIRESTEKVLFTETALFHYCALTDY